MPTITIEPNGKISVATTPAEEAMLTMVAADQGSDALDAVLNLHYKRLVETTMNARFAKLPPADAAAVLEKFAAQGVSDGRS
jgi:hypothetical protein